MSCGSAPEAVNEDGEALMPKRRHLKKTDPKQCIRCHTVRGAYILRSLPYCQACFQSTVRQRIIRNLYPPMRSLISRKSAVMRPYIQPGQVLIGVSGGAGSMALLDHLDMEGLIGRQDEQRVAADKTKGEKEVVWRHGTVVYVEFSGVTGMGGRIEEMGGMAKARGLGFLGVRAEEVFDEGLSQRLDGKSRMLPLSVNIRDPDLAISAGPSNPSSPLTRLQALLSSLPPASRPSILQNILDHILNLAARCLPNVSHLLLGETSTREAQRVISATAMGRGWALPLELSGALYLGSPTQEGKVLRLKPMKEITLKEAAIHCHVRKIPTVNQRQWVDGRSSGGRGKGMTSLEMLTEQFIAGLSVTHPSTVSTINKTGDKLVFAGDKASKELCPLCQMPAEPSAQAWKSRTALTSLQDDNISERTKQGLAPLLCYSCLTTMTPGRGKGDVEGVDMPIWVGEEIHRRRGRDEIHQSIHSYLIGDVEP